ncbi:MAG: HAMP domain-containing protein [Candidatus Cloacimonetes bacterium]|nr:HAMP domain-containing protein [Candidatus Cloacimonadota bacterium]
MKNLSFMWKLFLTFFIIIVLTAGLIVHFASREIKNNYLQNLELTLENYAQLIQKFITSFVLENDYQHIKSTTHDLGNELGIRCTVIRSDGTVLGDSEEDVQNMENHSNRPEVIGALRSGIGKSVRFSETLKKDMLYVAVPIVQNDKVIGVVRTSSFLENIQRSIHVITKDILNISIVITVLALILSILITQAYTKPVRDIAQVAQRIKEGDFKARLYTRRRDELGRLAESLNEMARELEMYITSLNQEQEELKTILSSMVEALIVLNPDGIIVTANKIFSEIIHCELNKLVGKRYWEYIRQEEFGNLLTNVLDTNNSATKEIEIKGKIYLTSASIILGIPEKRIIVVMHDITELKRLEEMKTDFVANVAHELKTPLTAIKGFAETLEEEIDSAHKRFIKIIRSNTDRLINIVSDLLVLSNLENKHDIINYKKFDLEKLIENSLLIEQKKIDEKNIHITFDYDSSIKKFQADPFLIEQLMINLLDNAVTYTEKKGKIMIDVSLEDNQVIIEIEDNGIGIPEYSLPRIFERFYVVDKSRSRQLGGTGLGLSIVKHIVLAHNGEIYVESKVGEGTKFIIILPYNA